MEQRSVLAFAVIVCAFQARLGVAAPTELDSRAFEFEVVVSLPAERTEVWETMTGDISGWWDHRFSQSPPRFFIDARPGGGFWEYFDPAGDFGVRHAEVLLAEEGRRLTMDGALGFTGNAVTIITSWTLEDGEDGQTKLTAKISFSGAFKGGWQDALERVWHHFLDVRLRGYLAAGCRGGGPCEAFE